MSVYPENRCLYCRPAEADNKKVPEGFSATQGRIVHIRVATLIRRHMDVRTLRDTIISPASDVSLTSRNTRRAEHAFDRALSEPFVQPVYRPALIIPGSLWGHNCFYFRLNGLSVLICFNKTKISLIIVRVNHFVRQIFVKH
jgi:hypothetical protein